MTPTCPNCNRKFKEGEKIEAHIVSVFHDIPSSRTYCIERPTVCLAIKHLCCVEEE